MPKIIRRHEALFPGDKDNYLPRLNKAKELLKTWAIMLDQIDRKQGINNQHELDGLMKMIEDI